MDRMPIKSLIFGSVTGDRTRTLRLERAIKAFWRVLHRLVMIRITRSRSDIYARFLLASVWLTLDRFRRSVVTTASPEFMGLLCYALRHARYRGSTPGRSEAGPYAAVAAPGGRGSWCGRSKTFNRAIQSSGRPRNACNSSPWAWPDITLPSRRSRIGNLFLNSAIHSSSFWGRFKRNSMTQQC